MAALVGFFGLTILEAVGIIGATSAVVGTGFAVAQGQKQKKAQKRANAQQIESQNRQFAQQEARVSKQEKMQQAKELALNTRLSRKRRAQTAGRLGIGLGGRRSLFFEGNELGVPEEGQRATLG